jgi:hypothetical protein
MSDPAQITDYKAATVEQLLARAAHDETILRRRYSRTTRNEWLGDLADCVTELRLRGIDYYARRARG